MWTIKMSNFWWHSTDKRKINFYKKKRFNYTSNKGGNPCPTTTFADQLTSTAKLTAAGLGPCENNSATIIHGIEPGPIAKNIM